MHGAPFRVVQPQSGDQLVERVASGPGPSPLDVTDGLNAHAAGDPSGEVRLRQSTGLPITPKEEAELLRSVVAPVRLDAPVIPFARLTPSLGGPV